MSNEVDRPAFNAVTVRVRNNRKSIVIFKLEPWGERFSMPPGAVFEVTARGPEGDTLELEWGKGDVTVFGWPGSVVRVRCNGQGLGLRGGADREPAPYVPEGMRTRDWLSEMASAAVQ